MVYFTIHNLVRLDTVVQPKEHCVFSSSKSAACWEPWTKHSFEGRLTMLSSIVLLVLLGGASWAFPLKISRADS